MFIISTFAYQDFSSYTFSAHLITPCWLLIFLCLFSGMYSTRLVRDFCTFHCDVVENSLMHSQEYSKRKLKFVVWQYSVQWKLTGKQLISYCHNWNVAYYAISYVTKPTTYQTLELSTSSDDRGKGENLLWCPNLQRLNLGWCKGKGKCPSKNCATKDQFFLLATVMKRGK